MKPGLLNPVSFICLVIFRLTDKLSGRTFIIIIITKEKLSSVFFRLHNNQCDVLSKTLIPFI